MDGETVTGPRLVSGEVIALAVAERPPPAPACWTPSTSSVDIELGGQAVGSQVPADLAGVTAVPGVRVADNVANSRTSIIVPPRPD